MKERLDILLTERGFFESREKAKAVIMAGEVFVNGQREDKAGSKFDREVEIEVKGKTLKYVSRGGLKLEKAIEVYKPVLEGKVCIDIGSSTGGFTDCMLQNGATKVYAIDVGTNQLAWKLREDPRVVSMEKTNIRYVTEDDLPEKADFASVDVSFISLTKVLPAAVNLLKPGAEMVCLIKPQFEAGREKVGKKGVVRDFSVHEEVIEMVIRFAGELNFIIRGLTFSPVKGPEGNIEYLLYIEKRGEMQEDGCVSDILNEVKKVGFNSSTLIDEGIYLDINYVYDMSTHKLKNSVTFRGEKVPLTNDKPKQRRELLEKYNISKEYLQEKSDKLLDTVLTDWKNYSGSPYSKDNMGRLTIEKDEFLS